jgi:hypothetical protein
MSNNQPKSLRITAHATPMDSDPPNAHEFYAAFGMFMVAWSRLEGHVGGVLLQILTLPEAAVLKAEFPKNWKGRIELWRNAFNKLPSLAAIAPGALGYIKEVEREVEARHVGAHAIWDEFVKGAPEPTITAKMIGPKRGSKGMIETNYYKIPLSMLRSSIGVANNLNRELLTVTNYLGHLHKLP